MKAVAGNWGDRCLDASRILAIAAAALVPASTAAASVAIVFMLAAWLVSGRALHTLRASASQRMGQAILLFYAVLVLAMFYGAATWAERWGSLWSWRKMMLGFIILGFFAEELWKQRFLLAFVLVAAAGLMLSYLSALGVIPSRTDQPGVLLTNHATQGMMFALAALCCLELRVTAGRRLLLAAALLFTINIVFISTSRSAYLTLACVALAWGGARLGWRRLPLVAGAILTLAFLAFVVSPTLRDRVQQGIDEARVYQTAVEYTSAGVRMVFLVNTLELARDRPLQGYGTGSFAREYNKRFAGSDGDWRRTPTSDPHNQYLFIAVENGLLGLAAFIVVLVAVFYSARGAGMYGGVARAALLAWCMTSLFNSHFRTFPEGHLIWLLVGAMLAVAPARPRYQNGQVSAGTALQ